MKTLTLAQVAQLLDCAPPSGPAVAVTGVNTLQLAGDTELAYINNPKYRRQVRSTRAAAVIVQQDIKLGADIGRPILSVKDADLAVAQVLEALAPPIPRPPAGIDPLARISPSAKLGDSVAAGPFVNVGANVRIGARTVLHSGVYIGDDSIIGDDCELFPNVVIRERVEVGSRVIINAGSVLGTDGFGYRWDGKKHAKIPQIGRVIIQDDVEIGSCVCIDRAKFNATIIGRGTKIDNLVQVAHNVEIGQHCIVVGQVGLAGSAKLGNGVVLGGQSAVRDHVTIGDRGVVAACAGVVHDVLPATVVSGLPAMNHRQNLREQAALRRLPELLVQMRQLTEQVSQLQNQVRKLQPEKHS